VAVAVGGSFVGVIDGSIKTVGVGEGRGVLVEVGSCGSLAFAGRGVLVGVSLVLSEPIQAVA
jgi:hypothetical protein